MFTYLKRAWQENVTKLGPTEYNRMEDGIAAALGTDFVTAVGLNSAINVNAPGTAAVAFPGQAAPLAGDAVLVTAGASAGVYVWNGDNVAMTLVKAGANFTRGHRVAHLPNGSTMPLGTWACSTATSFRLASGTEPWRIVGASGNPAFIAPWAAWDQTQRPARFRKNAEGRVFIDGTVQTSGAVAQFGYILQLPTGYIPAGSMLQQFVVTGTYVMSVSVMDSGQGANAGKLRVERAMVANDYIFLSPISFDTI